ncbi:MAG: cyclic lactone autoinducer peptide [Lachnospiraceae bacterium]|nr:cyclic lactone autoinducer peptide [Lachnospiraceae bacterium]
MQKKENKVLKLIAKAGFVSAKAAAGEPSWYDCYQPKTPSNLKEVIKRK